MKRLVLVVAALGIAASASAQDADIKNSGEFRLRYQNLENAAGTGESRDAGFTHRFKWNITARKGENLQAMLSLVHGAGWGYATAESSLNPTPGTNAPDTATAENVMLVNRAWGWWKSSDALSFKFGRMGIEIADGAVFSENDWEPNPTAHEGVMAMWDMDFAKLALFGVKNVDTVPAAGADTEANFYGVSADLKNMPEAIKTANIHAIQLNADPGSLGVASAVGLQHIGATVGGDVAGFMYKGTLAYQMGSVKATPEQDINAMMYDLMLGYGLPEIMGLKISAGYHMDTGDKTGTTEKLEGYTPMFYDRHNYAGLMDVVEWGNLTYWNVNASMMPMETVEVGLGYYMFSQTENGAGVNFGTPYFSGVALGSSDEIGSELDVYANKSYDNGMKIGARYSTFMVGNGLKNGTPAAGKSPSEIFLQASLSF